MQKNQKRVIWQIIPTFKNILLCFTVCESVSFSDFIEISFSLVNLLSHRCIYAVEISELSVKQLVDDATRFCEIGSNETTA